MPSSPVDYDSELRLHTDELFRVCRIRGHDQVLDVGCGAGQTTRRAARTASAGAALGIDVSAPMIDRARELTQAECLQNVTYECADAQVHPFPTERYDIVISRFGTMFFDDPVVAFANIGRALRPGGRLVMMVWQGRAQNEWEVAIRDSLEPFERLASAADASDPFSLAEPATVEQVLGAAGFVEVAFTDVHEPVFYGADIPAALGWVCSFSSTSYILKRLDRARAERALDQLREMLSAHAGPEGDVWFDSHAWIVTARRRARGRAP